MTDSVTLNSDLKKTQLDILSRFVKACTDNNITAFAYYGTLIGTIRHQGFIPWDDDIDMAMLRPDYNKLKEIDWRSYDLGLLMPGQDGGSPYLISKIYDPSTRLDENMDNKVHFLGINVDVFPIDYVDERPVIGDLRQFILAILKVSVAVKNIKINRNRAWFKNLILKVGKCFLVPLNICSLTRFSNKLADLKGRVFENSGVTLGVYGSKEIFPAGFYLDLETRKFEGKDISVLCQYDILLTGIYGDYMTPPPLEARVSHHDFEAF